MYCSGYICKLIFSVDQHHIPVTKSSLDIMEAIYTNSELRTLNIALGIKSQVYKVHLVNIHFPLELFLNHRLPSAEDGVRIVHVGSKDSPESSFGVPWRVKVSISTFGKSNMALREFVHPTSHGLQ